MSAQDLEPGAPRRAAAGLVQAAVHRHGWPVCAGICVAGVWLAQQQSVLPAPGLAGLGLAAALLLTVVLGTLLSAAEGNWRGLLRLAVLAALMGAAAFCWASLSGARAVAHSLDPADEARNLLVQGRIASLPDRVERGLRFAFEVQDCAGCSVQDHTVLLGWYADEASAAPSIPVLRAGQRWQLTVQLRRRYGSVNPHGFDTELWLLEQGVAATGSVRPREGFALLQENAAGFGRVAIERLRGRLRSAIEQGLDPSPERGVVVALALGDQQSVSASAWSLYNATGVGHLLSISGLHITMVASLLGGIAAWGWRRSRRLVHRLPAPEVFWLASALGALAYALLAGWSVPAQRTVWMLMAVVAARLIARQSSAGHVLSSAAVIVLIIDPLAVLSPGAWFSFGAVAFLMLAGQRVAEQDTDDEADARPGWLARMRQAARAQWAVTLGTLPLAVLFFSTVSLVSPLANAVAIPWVSLIITPLALAGAMLILIIEPVGQGALAGAAALMAPLNAALSWAGSQPWATLSLPAPSPWMLVLAVMGGIGLVLVRGWRRLLAAPLLLPLLLNPGHPPDAHTWRTTFIDVGQGMAVLIQRGERAWLYDTGALYSEQSNAGQRIVLPLLRAWGVRRLDGLIVSHADSDHSGGAAAVLQAMPVAWMASSLSPDHALPGLARRLGVRTLPCAQGQGFSAEGLRMDFLHPPAEWLNGPIIKTNALSCTLRVDDGRRAVLLTGDIEAAQETRLLAWDAAGLRSDVLLVPHHGSKTSSTAAFIAAVAPALAIVQAGWRNRFGHPHPDVLQRYAAAGVQVLGTAETGAIEVTVDSGGTLQLIRHREVRVPYWRTAIQSARPPSNPASGEKLEPGRGR
ncbi:MAG TPA: DNA internalization-related competence protein ComEC/Rec2 [Burkholderiaceae bacterium]|nr:DNA internalization-related competence protein ComEC/Rec2 [Burkholderiaceae bacterium]